MAQDKNKKKTSSKSSNWWLDPINFFDAAYEFPEKKRNYAAPPGETKKRMEAAGYPRTESGGAYGPHNEILDFMTDPDMAKLSKVWDALYDGMYYHQVLGGGTGIGNIAGGGLPMVIEGLRSGDIGRDIGYHMPMTGESRGSGIGNWIAGGVPSQLNMTRKITDFLRGSPHQGPPDVQGSASRLMNARARNRTRNPSWNESDLSRLEQETPKRIRERSRGAF